MATARTTNTAPKTPAVKKPAAKRATNPKAVKVTVPSPDEALRKEVDDLLQRAATLESRVKEQAQRTTQLLEERERMQQDLAESGRQLADEAVTNEHLSKINESLRETVESNLEDLRLKLKDISNLSEANEKLVGQVKHYSEALNDTNTKLSKAQSKLAKVPGFIRALFGAK